MTERLIARANGCRGKVENTAYRLGRNGFCTIYFLFGYHNYYTCAFVVLLSSYVSV